MTHVEAQLALSVSGIAAVDLQHSIFEFEPRELLLHWLGLEQLEIEPKIRIAGLPSYAAALPIDTIGGVCASTALKNRNRLRADGSQLRGGPGLVGDLHQEHAPSLFHQLRIRQTLRHLHSHLGIDIHRRQTVAVENLLRLPQPHRTIDLPQRSRQGELIGFRKGCPQVAQGILESPYLGREWLPFHVRNKRERRLAEAQAGT